MFDGEKIRCAGALITEEHLVSAARCVTNIDLRRSYVYFGEGHFVKDFSDWYAIQKAVPHEKFTRN